MKIIILILLILTTLRPMLLEKQDDLPPLLLPLYLPYIVNGMDDCYCPGSECVCR